MSTVGADSIDLLDDCYTFKLWNGKPEGPCPTLIPFSCVLPSTFNHDDAQHPLPPSYVSHPTDISCVFVRSYYSMHVYVERARHRKLGFLTTRQQ
jgi:hypothetical protein